MWEELKDRVRERTDHYKVNGIDKSNGFAGARTCGTNQLDY